MSRPAFAVKKREVCPICTRLPKQCSFFQRTRFLKFDENELKSAKIRAERFEQFHADPCPVCKFDKAECWEKKVKRVKLMLKKNAGFVLGGQRHYYLEPEQMTEAAKTLRCKPLSRGHFLSKYIPIMPEWWKQAKGIA